MDELTPIERSWTETAQQCAPGGCLEAEKIIEIAERGKRASDYSASMAHIVTCPTCRQTLKMLSATEALKPRKRFVLNWPVARYLVAAGVAAAIVALWLGMPRGANSVHRGTDFAVRDSAPKKESVIKGPEPKQPRGVVAEKHDRKIAPSGVAPKPRTHIANRVRPHRPKAIPDTPTPPERSLVAEAHGTLEGTVGYAEVIEGEVGSGGVVQGEVNRKPPPPPEH